MPPFLVPDGSAATGERRAQRLREAGIGLAALALTLSPAAGKDAEKPRSTGASPQIESPPLPPPRPDRAPEPTPASQPKEPAKSELNGEPKPQAVVPPKGPSSDDPTPCLDRISKLGMKIEPLAPIAAGACGAEHPFRMTAMPDGVAAAPGAEVGCPMAEALARWVLEVVEPEAEKHLKLVPKKVLIGTSYECRGQNRDAAAKLSEHAFANAVDVMGFAFEKGPTLNVTMRGDDTPEGRFQAAVRSGACTYFNTVLGPGSDPSHSDHLHLDKRERKAGMRICQ